LSILYGDSKEISVHYGEGAIMVPMIQTIEMDMGGWLAVTTEPATMGVFGRTRSDALAELDKAIARRLELQGDQSPISGR
jgi:hypothetical protein